MSDANDQNTAQPSGPINCARGCGFFGNPLTENMCSKCYKEIQADICPPATTVPTPEQPKPEPEAEPEEPAKEMECIKIEPAAPSKVEPPKFTAGGKKDDGPPAKKRVQKNKHKCFMCKKKVGLMGFECKCTFVFCAEHRYAEAHKCTHDHMTEQRDKLSRDNPVIKAEKLNRI